jgi:hypothetical protein
MMRKGVAVSKPTRRLKQIEVSDSLAVNIGRARTARKRKAAAVMTDSLRAAGLSINRTLARFF